MKDFTIDIKLNKKGKSAEIVIKGQLNITNTTKIKEELGKTLSLKKVNILIENVDDMDISFIQTLEAFKLTCQANKIELILNSHVNEDLNLLLTRAGLQNIL